MNKYKFWADILAITHGLFILGTITVFVYSLLTGSELVGLIWFLVLLVMWIIWKRCPLLIWENQLREKHDPKTKYAEDFITHYVRKYLGVSLPNKTVVTGTIALFAILIIKYSLQWI